MPIEIKELIIRATIRDDAEKSTDKPESSVAQEVNSTNEEAVVTQCVEQIMQILQLRNER